jgi:hypothetical protein
VRRSDIDGLTLAIGLVLGLAAHPLQSAFRLEVISKKSFGPIRLRRASIGVGRSLIVLEMPVYLPQGHFLRVPAAIPHRCEYIEREILRSEQLTSALIWNQNPIF